MSSRWRCRTPRGGPAPGKPPVYQVGGKSFVFFRNPRPDAVDPETGERYDDVIVFWVADEADKQALIADEDSPFFTTPHFDGHLSVLVRGKDLPNLSYGELAEVVQDAWLARASPRRADQWLRAMGPGGMGGGSPPCRKPLGEATRPFGIRLIFN